MKTNSRKLTGIALAAATMLLAAPLTVVAKDRDVGHCAGVNSCKGHSSCKTASNACKGQNSCKGQGYVEVNKTTCDQLGGKFEAAVKQDKKAKKSY